MDLRSSVLVVAIYCALAVTAVLLVVTGYRWYVRPFAEAHLRSVAVDSPELSQQQASRARGADPRAAHRRQAYELALRRIEELRRLLDQKDALLRDKMELINKRTQEYQQLKKQTDQYVGWLSDMVAQSSWDTAGGSPQQQATANLAGIDGLQQELTSSSIADKTLEAALTQAEWELQQAYAEIALAQSLGLAGQQAALQTAAEGILVEIGRPAIQPLTAALADSRVAVRRWAAGMLGAIGAPAIEATDALIAATRDDDEQVRTAARRALVQIENDF